MTWKIHKYQTVSNIDYMLLDIFCIDKSMYCCSFNNAIVCAIVQEQAWGRVAPPPLLAPARGNGRLRKAQVQANKPASFLLPEEEDTLAGARAKVGQRCCCCQSRRIGGVASASCIGEHRKTTSTFAFVVNISCLACTEFSILGILLSIRGGGVVL